MVVVVEVVHNLPVLYVPKVYVTALGRPFQVEELRVNILVLEPSLFV